MGTRTSTRSYLGLARRWRGPVSHGEHPEMGHLQGQVLRREKGWTASQGKRGWAAGRGLNDKKTHYSSSQTAGFRQRPQGDVISIQVLQSDSWGGRAGKLTSSCSLSCWVSLSHTQMVTLVSLSFNNPHISHVPTMRTYTRVLTCTRAVCPCPSAVLELLDTLFSHLAGSLPCSGWGLSFLELILCPHVTP